MKQSLSDWFWGQVSPYLNQYNREQEFYKILEEAFTEGADAMFPSEIAPRITVREKFKEWIEKRR